MSTDKLIEKVQKLLTLARNDGASEAEADTALQMANKLLLIHNLTMADVDTEEEDGDGLLRKDGVVTIGDNGEEGKWEGTLMAVLCEYNLCGCVINSIKGNKQSTMTIVGSKENIEVVLYLFHAGRDLYRALSKTRHSEYRKAVLFQWTSKGYTEKDLYKMETEEGSRMLLRRSVWIRSYLKGCVAGLFNKLERQRRQIIEEEQRELEAKIEQERIDAILIAEAEGGSSEDVPDQTALGMGKMELMVLDIKEKIENKLDESFDETEEDVEVKQSKKWSVDPESEAFTLGITDAHRSQITRAID